MTVKIKATLPKGDKDGLMHLTDQLRRDPRAIVVVAVLTPYAITDRLDDDDETIVHCEIDQIEVPAGDMEPSALETLLRTQYEQRTGKQPLPFGSIMDFDPDTGEIHRTASDDDQAGDR
jgi:hypothetical protein